jgi:hypothetical protein
VKESEERARLAVAMESLLLITCPKDKGGLGGGPATRGVMMVAPGSERSNPEIYKALKSKHWQRAFLDRLVEADMFTVERKGNTDFYSTGPGVDKLVDHLFDDYKNNYGILLSKIVFGDGTVDDFVRDLQLSILEKSAEKGDERATFLLSQLQKKINEAEYEPEPEDEGPGDEELPSSLLGKLEALRQRHIEARKDAGEPVPSITITTEEGAALLNNLGTLKKVLEENLKHHTEIARRYTDLDIVVQDLRNDFGQLRSEVRSQKKSVDQLVASTQGVLRKLDTAQAPDAVLAEVASLRGSIAAIEKKLTTSDRLQNAIDTARASLELLTEVATEGKT